MNKYATVVFTLIIIMILCSSCISEGDKSSNQVEMIDQTDELKEWKEISNKAISYLDENELKELAKEEWNYVLTVAGNKVESDGVIHVEKTSFDVILIEGQTLVSSQIPQLSQAGAISGNYYDHLLSFSIEPTEFSGTDGTIVASTIYKYRNLQKGSVIEIQISDELKERLGFITNIIKIYTV